MRTRLIFAEWNPGAATPNASHNFINQIGARMWKRDAVFDDTRVRPFTSEHLFEKSLNVGDLSGVGDQLQDLANGVRRVSRTQPKDHLFFIEKICEGDRHLGAERFIGLCGKPSYPVK